jgi:hypothetical protein
MTAVRGRYVNGSVVLEGPTDWPNGIEVLVEPIPAGDAIGMREEDWPTTPEGIAALLKAWDEIEPLEFTPAEEADIAAWRQKVKEYTIAHMNDGIDGLFP